MRLGLMLGYSGATISLPIDMIKAADRMGVYAVWTAEAYGSDCVTPLAWIRKFRAAAFSSIRPARTPGPWR